MHEDSHLETIHAIVHRGDDWYYGECMEVAVVSQGRTLDELVDGLREAVSLHLDGEDTEAIGLVPDPGLSISFEVPVR